MSTPRGRLPEINRVPFDVHAANQALPTAQRAAENFLRPYKGYSSIRQRRSEMYANYNSMQFYLNRRKGDIRYSVSYTLSKAEGNSSGNGDNLEDAVENRHRVGLDRMLWSNDYPHITSDWPYSWKTINATFAGVPADERHALLAGNAQRIFGFGR